MNLDENWIYIEKYLDYFRNTLEDLGYFINDRLISDELEDNVRVLNSYKDANTTNFETLPKWFKEVPLF